MKQFVKQCDRLAVYVAKMKTHREQIISMCDLRDLWSTLSWLRNATPAPEQHSKLWDSFTIHFKNVTPLFEHRRSCTSCVPNSHVHSLLVIESAKNKRGMYAPVPAARSADRSRLHLLFWKFLSYSSPQKRLFSPPTLSSNEISEFSEISMTRGCYMSLF